MKLTKGDKNMLSLIRDFHIEHGKYPTKTEMGKLIGAKNPRQVGWWYANRLPHTLIKDVEKKDKIKTVTTTTNYNRVVIDWDKINE